MRTCVVCGVGIEERHGRATVCDGIECTRKRSQKYVLRYRALNQEKFRARQNAQKKAQRSRRPLPTKVCVICGTCFANIHHNAKLCSDACRDSHIKQQRDSKAEHRRQIERERYSIRKNDAEFMAQRRANSARNRVGEDREAYLVKKRAEYYRNRDKRLAHDTARRNSKLDYYRALARARNSEKSAALKLIREIQTKGIEALL